MTAVGWMRTLALALVGFVWAANAVSAADSESPTPVDAAEAEVSEAPDERWSSFLPLYGDAAREQGYELPLPLGISTSVIYMRRDVKVKNVKVGIGEESLQSVDDLLKVDVKTEVVNVATRFDAWILPFLNVYALLGFTDNASDVRLRVRSPVPGQDFIEINQDGGFDGLTWGGGVTVAGGYEWMFATFDTTYAVTDIGLDSDIPALIMSVRTGWNGEIKGVPTRLWVGGTYWDTERTVRGSTTLPGGEVLRFSVKQGPVDPYNANVGAHVELSRHWQLVVDTGFNFDDAFTLVANLSYRF